MLAVAQERGGDRRVARGGEKVSRPFVPDSERTAAQYLALGCTREVRRDAARRPTRDERAIRIEACPRAC
jgi:hypothetical protein